MRYASKDNLPTISRNSTRSSTRQASPHKYSGRLKKMNQGDMSLWTPPLEENHQKIHITNSGLKMQYEKKKKRKTIPKTGFGIDTREGHMHFIPNGRTFKINDFPVSKTVPLLPGDVITMRPNHTLLYRGKMKSKKTQVNFDTLEIKRTRAENEQLHIALDKEIETNQAYISQFEERTKMHEEEIQQMEEQKVKLLKDQEDAKATMESQMLETKKRHEASLAEQQALFEKKKAEQEAILKQREEEASARMKELEENAKKRQEEIQHKQDAMMEKFQQEKAKAEAALEEKITAAEALTAKTEEKLALREQQLNALEQVLECSRRTGDTLVTIPDVHELLSRILGKSKNQKPGEGIVYITVLKCSNLIDRDLKDVNEPYVQVVCKEKSGRTPICRNTLNPKWDIGATFCFIVTKDDVIRFNVFDNDPFSSQDIDLGELTINVSTLKKNATTSLTNNLEKTSQGDLSVNLFYCDYETQM